ncbi:MAG: type I restriction enzyme HsdR N-terminal domain-containing protein [Desulfotignum sp.]|nr:type I restriction enzyme HsdR N-terminal domain-containing protein [Desulfotignum sp.]MCF8113673.1 type I restriction enzyme HsdR N-terminal domain-containing protein [Desulfotignum sp.]MCF8126373.1 type I restriction enzyme HsdR N-terminal domain-containing protein [Desulfotignum sp.]
MMEQIKDYITGNEIRNMGSEISRQNFEKFLVEIKGYKKEDIHVDAPLTVQFKGEDYPSSIDLVVCLKDRAVMAVTCVAGAIGSYEREILAGARLIREYQIPFAVSTDAKNAVIIDTLSGKTTGQGLSSIPSRGKMEKMLPDLVFVPLDKTKKEREMIIYRSFNLEKINR